MEENVKDTLDEVYETKAAISSSFKTYGEFAEWLLKEQEKARKAGITFCAA